ncbi:MAG: glycosyltransferase family 39 protein [Anaerolineae bacterium]|nr:glycosyltransferase family 39 protein [Anaerolineae bacterium]
MKKSAWLDRRLWKRVTPAILILVAIMLLSAVLHFTNIEAIGDANAYYTAAVKSMLQSAHNFFFVAAEPGGSVTVDKPPLGLWIEAAFAAVLGVSGFSVSLPNILAGIFSIPLLYHLVKKHLGSLAGLLAGLVMAITPVVLGTDRNNTMDGMLVFCLLLAVWSFIAATETGKLRWLLLGGFIVGLGFNIKMLQAFLPVPAFFAVYFFGARVKWWRKIVSLGLAAAVMLIVSLSWAVIVDLTPADARPYVGSSTDNTVMELIVGHNGLNRLFGGRRAQANKLPPGTDGPDGFAQNQSPDNPRPPREAIEACNGLAIGDACTVNLLNGRTVSGTCAEVQGLLSCEVQDGPDADARGQSGNQGGAGSAFSGEVGTPSAIRFFIPPLGKEMSWLLPFALVSLVVLLFTARLHWLFEAPHKALVLWGGWLVTCLVFFSVAEFFHAYYMIMLAPALGAVAGGGISALWAKHESIWAFLILALAAAATLAFQWWLALQFGENAWWLWLAAVLLIAGVFSLVVAQVARRKIMNLVAYSLVVMGVLAAPLAWSVLTVTSQSPDVNLPGAYQGDLTGVPGQNPDRRNVQENPLLLYLQENTQDVEYLVAVPNANSGASMVLATGRPVLYMGGFSGSDPVVDSADLQAMVAGGELRYILYSGNRSPGREIAAWLGSSCTLVPGYGSGQPAPTPQGQGRPNQEGGSALYQCGGSLAPYTGGQAAPAVNIPQDGPAGAVRKPPIEAIEACANLEASEACTVNLPNGRTFDGSCRNVQGETVCVAEGNRPPAGP